MKNLIISIVFCVFIPLLWNVALAQEPSGDGTNATVKDRDKAEMNTAAWDPSDLYADESKHVAVYFNIEAGNLVLSSRPAQVVHGNMPYKSRSGGEILIVAKDKAGEKIVSYYTPDIRKIRVFEGRDRESTFIQEAKDLIIRVPYDQNISQLTMTSTAIDKDQKTYDISRSVNKIYSKRR